MLYPLKFKPFYKDYIWGGRNLEKFGKELPDGIVAESWEISTHPDGLSIVDNGEFKGTSLADFVKKYGREIVGKSLSQDAVDKFPLLVKFIDANDKLSVQVHPKDEYARIHENGELGKNEMWYIISAKPGAKLIYDVSKGTTKDNFAKAVEENNIESCLNYIDVFEGDVLNIPAGLLHAIGEGIVIAEIQQNSNTTYRVFDYNRKDAQGNQRPLHIEKSLDVIDFSEKDSAKSEGIKVKVGEDSTKTYKIANKYFSIEVYDINGEVNEIADGNKFFIYVFIKGEAEIEFDGKYERVKTGQSVLIPASMGEYKLNGNFKALKAYVPDIEKDVIEPLRDLGFSKEEITENVSGLK